MLKADYEASFTMHFSMSGNPYLTGLPQCKRASERLSYLVLIVAAELGSCKNLLPAAQQDQKGTLPAAAAPARQI